MAGLGAKAARPGAGAAGWGSAGDCEIVKACDGPPEMVFCLSD